MRKRAVVALLAVLVFHLPASASIKDFGFYFAYDRLRGHDYLSEISGKANLIPWNFDVGALQLTDFPDRIIQTPSIKLLLTLPLTTATDHTSGINKAVFTNASGARLTYLNHVKSWLETGPGHLIQSTAYIAISEELYTLMYQGYFGPGGLNWQIFDSDPWTNRETMKSYLQSFIADVKTLFPSIPVVLVEGWWSTNPNNLNHAPSNVDVLGLDAYYYPTSSACDSTQRAIFDSQVTVAYDEAAAYGKPMIMVANSAVYNAPMQSTCQMQWFKDLADSRPSVKALLWWLYPTTDGIVGVREYPTQREFLLQMGDQVLRENVAVIIDSPAPNATISASAISLSGWAIDQSSLFGAGIDTLTLYLHPVGGGTPLYAGTATLGQYRPDVAAYLGGSQFTYSGWTRTTYEYPGLTGTFDLVVVPQSSMTGRTEPSRAGVVRVVIQP
jgi:hypothetical protein